MRSWMFRGVLLLVSMVSLLGCDAAFWDHSTLVLIDREACYYVDYGCDGGYCAAYSGSYDGVTCVYPVLPEDVADNDPADECGDDRDCDPYSMCLISFDVGSTSCVYTSDTNQYNNYY